MCVKSKGGTLTPILGATLQINVEPPRSPAPPGNLFKLGRPTLGRRPDNLTKFRDLPREIELGDGESVDGIFDPGQEAPDALGQMGGAVWTFVLTVNGKPAVLKGGKRLKAALQEALGPADKPTRVRITASGAPRSLGRQYHAVAVGASK